MKNQQQADMNKFSAVKTELAKDAAAYEDDVPFEAAVAAFIEKYNINIVAAAAAFPDNSGFSQEKKNAKIKMSKNGANTCGRATVTLNLQDKISISEQLFISPSNYSKESDSEAAKRAQFVKNLMLEHKDLLTGYVTEQRLTALQTDIDTFRNCQGTSEIEHEVSPFLTKAFEDSFAPVETCITNLKLLGRDYEETNNEFYTRLIASMVEPVINVHHTFLEVYAGGKDNGNPIPDMVFVLEKGKKSATTDWQGIALIERPRAGKDTLTGMYKDKVVYVGHINIERGKMNRMHLKIEV